MPTLVKDPPPAGFEELLERRELGQDLLDEMWEGVYVMNPAPSEGHADVAQQLAELLGPAARAAGLWLRMSIFNLGGAGRLPGPRRRADPSGETGCGRPSRRW